MSAKEQKGAAVALLATWMSTAPHDKEHAKQLADMLYRDFGFTLATAEAYAREWEQEGEKK